METVTRWIRGPSQKEELQKWKAQLRKESRALDREMRNLQIAHDKAKRELRILVKKNSPSAKILARELVRTKKQANRLASAKAQLGSISIQMDHQAAVLKMTGSLQKSAEMMKLSSSLVRVPVIQKSMQDMEREWVKAGIMEEMVDDTLDTSLGDQEGEEDEEGEEEVQKILLELAEKPFTSVGKVSDQLPTLAEPAVAEEASDEEELDTMQARLEALKS